MKYQILEFAESQDESWDYTGKMVPAYWELYRRKSFAIKWRIVGLPDYYERLGDVRALLRLTYQKHWDAAVRRKRRKDARGPLFSKNNAVSLCFTLSFIFGVAGVFMLIKVFA